jgi:DNA polymerase theta
LSELEHLKLIEQKADSSYSSTQLGTAIVASSLNPEDGIFIHGELKRATQSFVMDGDMHVFYTFTPVQVSDININWTIFLNEVVSLDDSGMRVLQLLGLNIDKISKL